MRRSLRGVYVHSDVGMYFLVRLAEVGTSAKYLGQFYTKLSSVRTQQQD